MGLFARASSLAIPGKTAGGLLHRGLAILEALLGARREARGEARVTTRREARVTTLLTARPAVQPTIPAEELVYRVAAIPAGLAAPVLLFRLLRDVLGLKQAALLAYDSRRHLYSPLAAIGLDTTSRHRLRFQPGANPDFNRAAAGRIVEVRGEELETFREYFSSRGFSAIRELVLVPYLHNQRLLGLLLAMGRERPLAGEALELLQSTMATAAQLLPQDEEEQPAEDPRPLAERVQTLLADCRSRGRPLILIRISLDELLRLAQERFPELESFRLYEFLVASCRRLLRGIGQVETPKPRVLFLLVHGMKDGDPPLLLRQLETALLSELRGLVDARTVDLRQEVRIVTDDPQAALSFLDS